MNRVQFLIEVARKRDERANGIEQTRYTIEDRKRAFNARQEARKIRDRAGSLNSGSIASAQSVLEVLRCTSGTDREVEMFLEMEQSLERFK